jgi:uncharacterized protein YegP (UPF0339 family)
MQTLRIKNIETFKSETNGQFYFNVRGLNGRVVVPSEGYTRKANRDKTVDLINSSLLRPVPIVERPARALVNRPARKVVKGFVAKKKPARSVKAARPKA